MQKMSYVKQQIKYTNKVEDRYTNAVWRLFSVLYRVIFEGGSSRGEYVAKINLNTTKLVGELEKRLSKMSRKEINNLMDFQYEVIKKRYDPSRWRDYVSKTAKELNANLKKFSKDEADRLLKEVNKVLNDFDSWEDAETEIKRRYRKVYNEIDKKELTKARQIVRTEVNRVNNQSKYEIGKRENMFKEWRTAGDEGVRPTHSAVNRKVKRMDKVFNVGADTMLYPCGGSLAEENVNCRCQVILRETK